MQINLWVTGYLLSVIGYRGLFGYGYPGCCINYQDLPQNSMFSDYNYSKSVS